MENMLGSVRTVAAAVERSFNNTSVSMFYVYGGNPTLQGIPNFMH